jgi:hypothetical protein
MRLALTNLDTGLFLGKSGWSADCKLATTFPDTETVASVAAQNNVRNAAAALIDGEPLQTRGFLWVTKPK